ncbi:Lipase [Trema orientale]|uniref:Lipase n=1 Tax=Trema orientale TaxID=63057 RepID=A0A2P5DD61_TREOI|nr:Lipase [Trema orientale]
MADGALVPAVFIFGDSVVDAGNNNALPTLVKSNFPPYGRDYHDQIPTGRFCNGKLAIDFLLEDYLYFDSSPPAYLSTKAVGRNILNGANFASAASGFHDSTADLYFAISLRKQLDYLKEYQARVVGMVGEANASSIFSNGLYVLSAGSSDLLQNYSISPLLQATYTMNQFFDLLLSNYADFIENLYQMGARKIGVTSLPPIGCLPAAITLFGSGNNQCVDMLNHNALVFNRGLNATSQRLLNRLSGLNLVVLDTYQPLYSLVISPVENGLLETSILCNSLAIGTCANASDYVFWDAFSSFGGRQPYNCL